MLRNRDGKYNTPISCDHRTAYVLLVDTSGSMMDVIEFEGRMLSKGECVAKIAERILQELYQRACRNGEVEDCYDVAMISYSGRGVMSHLGGAEGAFVGVSELRDKISRIGVSGVGRFSTPSDVRRCTEDGGVVLAPCGESPMYEALLWVYELLEQWCMQPESLDSAVPKVFHITDGVATDGSLDEIIDISRNIMSLGTNDGDVLMFNMQLGGADYGDAILFPTDGQVEEHTNKYFQKLAKASSLLPPSYDELVAKVRGAAIHERCRAIGYNSSVVDVLSLMEVGASEVFL